MTKTLVTYILVFTLLFVAILGVHFYFINEQGINLAFSLKKVYIFHALCSLLICTILLALSQKEKFKDQLGFLYLGSFVFKLVFFAMVFSSLFFYDLQLSKVDKISLLIPVFVFLIPEVFFITKTLRKIDSYKK